MTPILGDGTRNRLSVARSPTMGRRCRRPTDKRC